MGLAGSKGPSVFVAHERTFAASLDDVGALLERLGSEADPLWPGDRWPPLQLDKPLSMGARGGHGPIRYHVVAHEPGRSVRFRFTAPPGWNGVHELVVERAGPGRTRLRHALAMTPTGRARLSWPLVWKPVHDAMMEDLMDRAEAALTGTAPPPRAFGGRVRWGRRWAGVGGPDQLS